LGLCQKDKKKTEGGGDGSAPCALGVVAASDSSDLDDADEEDDDNEDAVISYEEQWLRFITDAATLNDSLLSSLFKQARFIAYDMQTQSVSVELSKDFILFKEWLDNSQEIWRPLLRKAFSLEATLNAQFTGINKVQRDKKQNSDIVVDQPTPQRVVSTAQSHTVQHKEKTSQTRPQEQYHGGSRYNKPTVVGPQRNELRVDVSDESVWKKASMLMRHFPGVITEIRENR
jgi:hypothetical protein